jgi:hypothetical protein
LVGFADDGSGVDADGAPVVLEVDGEVYGVRLGQARLKAWLVASTSSWNGDEVQLEVLRASVRIR